MRDSTNGKARAEEHPPQQHKRQGNHIMVNIMNPSIHKFYFKIMQPIFRRNKKA